MWRERRAAVPLYDLDVVGLHIFWVAALAGIIVVGALMGTMFIGQQFLQNVLGYSPLEAGAAILPAAALMVCTAPISARLVERCGSKTTVLSGYVACFAGFVVMLALWEEGVSYWAVAPAYGLVGMASGSPAHPRRTR
jgi:hypothetical protein